MTMQVLMDEHGCLCPDVFVQRGVTGWAYYDNPGYLRAQVIIVIMPDGNPPPVIITHPLNSNEPLHTIIDKALEKYQQSTLDKRG